ncbi:hypothetical protein [Ancylomarina sp.]|uniref:hypothetical protein n=1 Tax=Ancylomarina sp. TaxID=1970196 RepID=UPI003565E2DD
MKNTNRPVIYPKCRCEEGKESDWEHTNECCIGIHPIIRKGVGLILSILAMICFYDSLSTIIYMEDESFFWATFIAAFAFTYLAYEVLKSRPIKEVTIRCRNCDFKAIINFKDK